MLSIETSSGCSAPRSTYTAVIGLVGSSFWWKSFRCLLSQLVRAIGEDVQHRHRGISALPSGSSSLRARAMGPGPRRKDRPQAQPAQAGPNLAGVGHPVLIGAVVAGVEDQHLAALAHVAVLRPAPATGPGRAGSAPCRGSPCSSWCRRPAPPPWPDRRRPRTRSNDGENIAPGSLGLDSASTSTAISRDAQASGSQCCGPQLAAVDEVLLLEEAKRGERRIASASRT